MKRSALAFALASAALAGCQPDFVAPSAAPAATPSAAAGVAVPNLRGGGAETVPGRYLVLLRTDDVSRGTDVAALASATVGRAEVAAGGAAAGLRRGLVRRVYTAAVAGFAVELSDAAAAALRRDPAVALVEPDPVITASATQSGAPWGLDRLDQAALPLDRNYTYAASGSGVTVHILDSGIRLDHADFGGRAVSGYDAVTAGGTAADCHGHGTHVAGTVGGSTYGVAKAARLVAVRVLGCDGRGSGSGLLAALDWVVQQKQASPATPTVVNMSLGGGASAVIDSAVRRVVAAGVTVAVAAGNSAADACTQSPARAAEAITVGATTSGDAFASFSNYGACVDLLAPGVGVASAGIGSPTAAATMSGTSMATPHVAGAAALYLGANPAAAPAQVASALAGGAVTGAVSGLPAATPNQLLNVAFLAPSAPGSARSPARLVSGATAYCAEASGGTATGRPGLSAVLWSCHGGANQTWSLPPAGTMGEVRLYADLCLDAWGATHQPGQLLVVWSCHGGRNQQWELTSAGELRDPTGLCVGLATAAPEPNARLVLQRCDGSAGQRFRATPLGG